MHNKIISCNTVRDSKNSGKFLFKLKWKWENDVTKRCKGLQEMREEELEILHHVGNLR